MIVAGTRVVTIHDDGLSYDLAWRYTLATIVCQDPKRRIPRSLPKDKYLYEFYAFLRHAETQRAAGKVYEQALLWYETGVRHVLESLLITEASFAEIAKDLNVPEEVVLVYERVFFNVRDDAGKLLLNAVINLKYNVPLPDNHEASTLRGAAFAGGYPLVKRMVAVRDSAELAGMDSSKMIRELMDAELIRRLLGGRISTADLGRITGNVANLEKLKSASGDLDARLKESNDLNKTLLSMMAPHMIPQSMENNVEFFHTYKRRMAADANVRTNPVADSGLESAVKAWGNVIEQKMAQQ